MNGVTVQEVSRLVSKEVELMTSLLATLQKEEHVLINNQAEKLEHVISEKNTLLTEIIAVEKQRNEILSKAGFTIDSEGIKAFLDSAQTEPSLKDAWTSLLALSTQAKENNRTNGLLINRQMVRNQATLNILQKTDENTSVYGADGQSKTSSSSGRGIIAG